MGNACCEYQEPGVVQLQRQKSINDNIINGWKNAVETGNDSLCKILYQDYDHHNSTFLEVRFENGDNSLHTACRNGSYALAYFLLATCKMNPNNVNSKSGKTALHYACIQRNASLISLLFKYNADPYIPDMKNKIPLDIAKSEKYRSEDIETLIVHAMNYSNLNVSGTRGRSGSRTMDENGRVSDDNYYDFVHGNGNNNNGTGNNNSSGQPRFHMSLEDVAETKEAKIARIAHLNPWHNPYAKVTAKYSDGEEKETLINKPKKQAREMYLEAKKHLPQLSGWLKKQRPKPPYQWQKRWLVVVDDYVLWNDKQLNVNVNVNAGGDDGDSGSESTNKNNVHHHSKTESHNDILGMSNISEHDLFGSNDTVMTEQDRKKFRGNIKINNIKEIAIPPKEIKNDKNNGKGDKKTKNTKNKSDKGDSDHDVCFIIKWNHMGNNRDFLWKCSSKGERDSWVDGLKQHVDFYKTAEKL